jgi:hypothetical protein
VALFWGCEFRHSAMERGYRPNQSFSIISKPPRPNFSSSIDNGESRGPGTGVNSQTQKKPNVTRLLRAGI